MSNDNPTLVWKLQESLTEHDTRDERCYCALVYTVREILDDDIPQALWVNELPQDYPKKALAGTLESTTFPIGPYTLTACQDGSWRVSTQGRSRDDEREDEFDVAWGSGCDGLDGAKVAAQTALSVRGIPLKVKVRK